MAPSRNNRSRALALALAACASAYGATAAPLDASTLPERPEQRVGYAWPSHMSGGERHVDVNQVIAAGNQSGLALELLRLVAPEPQRCDCLLERWDQYAVCVQAFGLAKSALSFGVNGYDPWGQHVYIRGGGAYVPSEFDCFHTKKPTDFKNDFQAVCLGGKGARLDGRTWTALPKLLQGAPNRSVLMKIDIEESEWGVLESLSDADFARILSLHVEYHFNYRPPSVSELKRAKAVLQRVRQQLAVVDGIASYYGSPNLMKGTEVPKLLAVSYSSEPACNRENPAVQKR